MLRAAVIPTAHLRLHVLHHDQLRAVSLPFFRYRLGTSAYRVSHPSASVRATCRSRWPLLRMHLPPGAPRGTVDRCQGCLKVLAAAPLFSRKEPAHSSRCSSPPRGRKPARREQSKAGGFSPARRSATMPTAVCRDKVAQRVNVQGTFSRCGTEIFTGYVEGAREHTGRGHRTGWRNRRGVRESRKLDTI